MSTRQTVAAIVITGVVLLTLVGLVVYSCAGDQDPLDKTPRGLLKINDTHDKCSTQYELGHRVRISICYLGEDDPVVDIREFLANRPTIKGIQLTREEWKSFMNHVVLLDHIVKNGSKI